MTLELYVGPMFSGKSSYLITELKTYKGVLAFKPEIDARYSKNEIATHDKKFFPAINIPIENPEVILEHVHSGIQTIGIDEVQFFSPNVVAVIKELLDNGVRVLASGLDLDFRGEPFGSVPHLLALADKVVKLTAFCEVCGDRASRTQRLSQSKELVVVGESDQYCARCKKHHVISI